MGLLRAFITVLVLVILWQLIVWLTNSPHYILPGPTRVASAWIDNASLIITHSKITITEILLGLIIGTILGSVAAIVMSETALLRRWLLPVLVISQAIPVFALAPVLVLWLGYGIVSKIAMAALIIFFPITAAFHDGLRRTEPVLIDSAKALGCSGYKLLLRVKMPAALPAFASGLRVGSAVAPIGAIVGEWVGSSAGLGYLMLHSNARMQIDIMFAALLTLAIISITLYFSIDKMLRRMMPWQAGENIETDITFIKN